MTRLNLVLLLAVVVSAFYLVNVQYESRRLYVALDKARAQAQRIDADHEQLRVQRRSQATPARVQQIATQQLHMRAASLGVTEYVQPSPVAAAAQGAGGKP